MEQLKVGTVIQCVNPMKPIAIWKDGNDRIVANVIDVEMGLAGCLPDAQVLPGTFIYPPSDQIKIGETLKITSETLDAEIVPVQIKPRENHPGRLSVRNGKFKSGRKFHKARATLPRLGH